MSDEEILAERQFRAGISYMAIAQWRHAIERFEACLKANPYHRSAWNDLGLANLNLGDLANAEKAFKRAIDVNPKEPYAYNNLGRVYVREKKYQDADQLYRGQIELNANDKYAHHNLGISLRDQGKYSEALQEFDKAQAITPANPTLHINIGETYLRMGKEQEAMSEFEKAIELSPTPSVWNNVAYMLARRGKNLDRAEKLAQSAITVTTTRLRAANVSHPTRMELALNASLASYWDTMGVVLLKRGDLDRAERYLRSAWQLTHHGAAAEHLGDLETNKGGIEPAKVWYMLATTVRRPYTEDSEPMLRRTTASNQDALRTVAEEKFAKETRVVIPETSAKGDSTVLMVDASDSSTTTVSFIDGDNLSTVAPVLQKLKLPFSFPDSNPTTVLLESKLHCDGQSCTLAFVDSDVSSQDENLPLGQTPDRDISSRGAPLAPPTIPPLLVRQVHAKYPDKARDRRVHGVVTVKAMISTEGKPKDLHVIDGDVALQEAALDAVKDWRFIPAFRAGEAVEVPLTVNVNFNLQ